MIDREKLIELIDTVYVQRTICRSDGDPVHRYAVPLVDEDHVELLADYLLEHCQLLPNWTPVTERLPLEEYEEYKERWKDDEDPAFLVMIEHAVLPSSLYFDGERWYQEMHGSVYPYKVTHWMPLPEPPAKD